jgi:type IV pilus assembly protein PilE
MSTSSDGFTLIELLIAVAIVGILAAVAIPNYSDYVLRSYLVDATTALSAGRTSMEQYYQDNRTYVATGTFSPPCLTSTTVGKFTVVCATADVTAGAYLISATGSGVTSAFTYSINQTNMQRTTAIKTGWGTAPAACWIVKKGQSC